MSTTIIFQKERVIFDKLMDSNYVTYIESNEWKEKVKEFAEYYEYECQICFRDVRDHGGGTLHHIRYIDLFNEVGKNEVYCCKSCHIWR